MRGTQPQMHQVRFGWDTREKFFTGRVIRQKERQNVVLRAMVELTEWCLVIDWTR